jgi:AcrR family transcriptional regulator
MNKATRGLRADGESTRAKILDAAGEMFAATGYAETTSKAIASHAGVDLASINYHFGSRNGLYQAVLLEADSRLVNLANLQQLDQSKLSGGNKLRAVIDQLVQQAVGDQEGWHVRVVAQELLAPSSHVQVLYNSELQPKLSILKNIISEVSGIPPGDPALARCMLSVIAPCLMLLIGHRGIPGPVQEVLQMSHQAICDHLCRFALAGLEAVGLDYAKHNYE